eukprot:1157895-Pelagomonas_calceolata.AAC.12
MPTRAQERKARKCPCVVFAVALVRQQMSSLIFEGSTEISSFSPARLTYHHLKSQASAASKILSFLASLCGL